MVLLQVLENGGKKKQAYRKTHNGRNWAPILLATEGIFGPVGLNLKKIPAVFLRKVIFCETRCGKVEKRKDKDSYHEDNLSPIHPSLQWPDSI